jgi:hypothetical protein
MKGDFVVMPYHREKHEPKVHKCPPNKPRYQLGPTTGMERSSGFFFGKFSLVIYFYFFFENHEVLVFSRL